MPGRGDPWQLEFRDYAPDPERDQWTMRLGIKWALRLAPEVRIMVCSSLHGRNGSERMAVVRQVVCCEFGEAPVIAFPWGKVKGITLFDGAMYLAAMYGLDHPVPLSAQVTCIRYRVQP